MELAFPAMPEGRVAVFGAGAEQELSVFDPARTDVIQPFRPDYDHWAARGWNALVAPEGMYETAVVVLPRARPLGRDRIAQAAAHLAPGGVLWIDGQKTDGVDAALKELRGLTEVEPPLSKAHGKIFRIPGAGWVPGDWRAADIAAAPGYVTRPGVFSADAVDAGSAMLAAHLPERMPTRVVDLGAGWGWLSAQAVTRPGCEVIHLVEADRIALDCAERNVIDPRARFHWADARQFGLPEPVNAVIMNPPFHDGRAADPGLGAAFIRSAARLLTGAGRLWMVANRQLPYESVLREHFAEVSELGGDGRFKILSASGAGRVPAARAAGSKRKRIR